MPYLSQTLALTWERMVCGRESAQEGWHVNISGTSGERGARREGPAGFLGDVEGAERKGTHNLLLKEKQEFSGWQSEGRAFLSERAACAKTQKNGIAKTVLGYLTFFFES